MSNSALYDAKLVKEASERMKSRYGSKEKVISKSAKIEPVAEVVSAPKKRFIYDTPFNENSINYTINSNGVMGFKKEKDNSYNNITLESIISESEINPELMVAPLNWINKLNVSNVAFRKFAKNAYNEASKEYNRNSEYVLSKTNMDLYNDDLTDIQNAFLDTHMDDKLVFFESNDGIFAYSINSNEFITMTESELKSIDFNEYIKSLK